MCVPIEENNVRICEPKHEMIKAYVRLNGTLSVFLASPAPAYMCGMIPVVGKYLQDFGECMRVYDVSFDRNSLNQSKWAIKSYRIYGFTTSGIRCHKL